MTDIVRRPRSAGRRKMTTPSWMPPQPELPWCEGSLDGDLPPSAVRQWAEDYALAAVEAYKKSLKPYAYANHYMHNGKSRLTQLAFNAKTAGVKAVPLYRLDGGSDE